MKRKKLIIFSSLALSSAAVVASAIACSGEVGKVDDTAFNTAVTNLSGGTFAVSDATLKASATLFNTQFSEQSTNAAKLAFLKTDVTDFSDKVGDLVFTSVSSVVDGTDVKVTVSVANAAGTLSSSNITFTVNGFSAATNSDLEDVVSLQDSMPTTATVTSSLSTILSTNATPFTTYSIFLESITNAAVDSKTFPAVADLNEVTVALSNPVNTSGQRVVTFTLTKGSQKTTFTVTVTGFMSDDQDDVDDLADSMPTAAVVTGDAATKTSAAVTWTTYAEFLDAITNAAVSGKTFPATTALNGVSVAVNAGTNTSGHKVLTLTLTKTNAKAKTVDVTVTGFISDDQSDVNTLASSMPTTVAVSSANASKTSSSVVLTTEYSSFFAAITNPTASDTVKAFPTVSPTNGVTITVATNSNSSGTKSVTLTLTKGSTTATVNVTITGFLSDDQKDYEY